MIYNTLLKTNPSILHSPGLKNAVWYRVLNTPHYIGESKPDDLEIITWNSQPEPGAFEVSCQQHQILIHVLRPRKSWENKHKIDLTLEFLGTCQSTYVMGVDDYDALIVGDLAPIIAHYQESQSQILFNATINKFPFLPEPWNQREVELGEQHLSPYRYLNAGVWIIRRTEECQRFFSRCKMAEANFQDIVRENPMFYNFAGSEQIRVKLAYLSDPEGVSIDAECKVFQTINDEELYADQSQFIKTISCHHFL